MSLILASSSPTRRALLEAAGVQFSVAVPSLDEQVEAQAIGDIAPPTLAATLAQKKALGHPAPAGTLVLGCDQVLETPDGEAAFKAGNREALRAQLAALRGRSHRLITAAAIAEDRDIVWRGSEIATLAMRDFSDAFLESYLDDEFETVRGCVGGYRIEGRGAQLFGTVEGSHFAILGLPLLPLLAYLRTRGLAPR